MEWWQVVLSFVAALEWWQVVLGFMAAIIAGAVIGLLLSYLIPPFIIGYPFVSKTVSPSHMTSQFDKIPSTTPVVKKQAEFTIPELRAEFEYNRRIVTEFSGDNLLSLQTDVWDAHQYSAHKLPANLRDELDQGYADIHSLNSLVWLSTELVHRSSSLDELCRKLLTSIAERLDRINQIVELGSVE